MDYVWPGVALFGGVVLAVLLYLCLLWCGERRLCHRYKQGEKP